MATYQVTGRKSSGAAVLSIHIDAIDQDEVVVGEQDVVDMVKAYLLTVPGVVTTVAQKNEYVTTYV